MADFHEYLLIGPDGSRRALRLSEAPAAPIPAPEWLLRFLGQTARPGVRWHLIPSSAPGLPGKARLYLSPALTAAAGPPRDPRQARLKIERERLEKLTRESDHIRVEPVDRLPGSEPEHYRVTFLCRGIVGINSSRQPLYGDKHVVDVRCDESFPADVPILTWITPIWHPNIRHLDPKYVCVNKNEWLGGMGLDDLCRQMFEMVQYKNYHAESSPPFPLDREVAQWVLEYAEPRRIVDKKRRTYVDDKPFLRPATAPPASKITVLRPSTPPPPSPPSPQAPPSPRPGGVRVLPKAPQGSPADGNRRVTLLKKS